MEKEIKNRWANIVENWIYMLGKKGGAIDLFCIYRQTLVH